MVFSFFFFGLLTRTSSSFFFFFESEGGKGNSVRSQHVMVRVCTRWELSRLLVELFFFTPNCVLFFFSFLTQVAVLVASLDF